MELGSIYFFTATIHDSMPLLAQDRYKDVIIASLRNLSDRGLIDVFGFVIMPNHIHLIWRVNKLNGKEASQSSLLKFTAHQFKKMLIDNGGYGAVAPFAVDARNKLYEFWRRDAPALFLNSEQMAMQKLIYVHHNPLAAHWQLAHAAADYPYSSAAYYESGIDRFGFLKNIHEEYPIRK